MAALFGQLHLDWQMPIDAREYADSCNRLAHRGKCGRRGVREAGIALTFFNSGTPLDQVLPDQPWRERDVLVLFDGWLCNRVALATSMSLAPETGVGQVLASAWRRYGDRLFTKLEGGFALVIVDRGKRTVALARDVLGLRQLVYRIDQDKLTFASEESALLRARDQIDPRAVAHFFASTNALHGSFFLDIEALPPGGLLLLRDGKVQRTQQLPMLRNTPKRMSDQDAIAEFRALFQRAESRYTAALVPGTPVAVSLSGGVDSNLVLALARWPTIAAASWALPDFPSADEQPWAAQHATAAGITHHVLRVRDSSALSLVDPQWRRVSLNTPVSNIYRELKTQFYAKLQQAGIGMLSTGHFGDHGILDSGEWLAECLSRRDVASIAREYLWRIRYGEHGGKLWRDVGIRRLLRRALWSKARAAKPAAFVSPKTTQLLLQQPATEQLGFVAAPAFRARQLVLNFGHYAAFESAGEAEYSEAFGVHSFSPFRDVDLTAFLCSLPAPMSERRGVKKWLYREAMFGTRVPETIRLRAKSASLQPVFDRAVDHAARARFTTLLQHPDALWPQFVDRQYVLHILSQTRRLDSDSALIWRCASLELWRTALEQAGLAQRGLAVLG